MGFSQSFVAAFKFTMQYEVGPNFNFEDPEVKLGLCESPSQKKKTGYVCIAEDTGGETKFGIAKNSNTDVDIKKLTLEQAMQIYYDRYWKAVQCDVLDTPLAICLFDAAVNHGPGLSAKMLQRAIGVNADGFIGPQTLSKIKQFNSRELCDIILKSREDLFKSIASNRPSQQKFLKGWLSRVASIRSYIQKNYK